MKDEIKIKTVSEFIDLANEKFISLKDTDENFLPWFRGEQSVDLLTPLVPGIYRKFGGPLDNQELNSHVFEQAKIIEGNQMAKFKRFATKFLSSQNIESNSWNEYYLMQHYGMQTRLLDWTESALLALYFAVMNVDNKLDGRVWILSPHRLNYFSTNTLIKTINKGISCIYFPQSSISHPIIDKEGKVNLDELTRRYLNLDFSSDDNLSNDYYPLAIYPYLIDERMFSQQSCFTIFGNMVNGLLAASSKDDFIKSIIVDSTSKRYIQDELKWLGISNKSIYPDLAGICNSIEEGDNIDHLILKRVK